MAEQAELTFIEKIEKFRPYAHRPLSSESDATDETRKSGSPDSDNLASINSPHAHKDFLEEENISQAVGSDEAHSTARSLFTAVDDDKNEDCSQDHTTDPNCQTLEPESSSESDGETTNINVRQAAVTEVRDDYSHGTEPVSNDQGGFKAGQIFYINEKNSNLTAFTSFEELSQYIMEQQANPTRSVLADDVLNTVVGVSAHNVINHVTVGEYLNQLHARNQLIDVMVDVRGERFPAHRVVLCCHSTYFRNLFNQSKTRKIPFDLRIKGISADAFTAFLEFCYTGEFRVYPEIAADLLIVADYLQVSSLKKRCALITATLPVDQALKFIVNARGISQHRVYRNLFQRVLTNFSAAVMFDEFLEMDIDTLCRMVGSDELVVTSELNVFQAALRWIVHNVEERVKYTMRLMNHVRFCEMTSAEILQCAQTTGLIRGYDKFREAILIANWQRTAFDLGHLDPFNFPTPPKRLCFLGSSENAKSPNDKDVVSMPPPQATSTPKAKSAAPTYAKPVMMPPDVTMIKSPSMPVMDILMIGGYTAQGATDTPVFVERYDTRDNEWVHFCRLPVKRKYQAVAAFKGKLYLIGGAELVSQELRATKSLYELDINTKTWAQKTDMLIARQGHCACVVNGKIYAIGGKDQDNSVLQSVECYDPQTDTWTHACPMISPRFAASAATLAGGSILVAGGMGESGGVPSTLPVLNTVECYSAEQNSWSGRNNLRHPRCYANLVTVKDTLYLCCGATRSYNFKSSVLVSVTSLDRYDADDDVWSHVTDMVIPRHEAGVAAAGDRVFILGGVSTVADRALQSVESYNTKKARWDSNLQELPAPTTSVTCVTVASRWQTVTSELL